MSDEKQMLEQRIHQILQEAEAPYTGRPGEVFLDRAWHSGASYMVERVLAALDECTSDDAPPPPEASLDPEHCFIRLRALLPFRLRRRK